MHEPWLDKRSPSEPSAGADGAVTGDPTDDPEAAHARPDAELDLAARSRMANLRAMMFGARTEPARVDRFVILETLGAGGMGVVHAAYDPRLDRKIALKLVKTGAAAAGPDVEARLLREAQAMARLSHPNVVQVHEVGAWEGRLFIAMELVAGRSLADWLAARAHGWREVVRVFIDAGRGLAAAHAVGMVHRDFKPENVLVGDDGRVRVTDFGLARSEGREPGDTWREAGDPLAAIVADAGAGTAAFAGTPGYMSPEQFLGEPATPASDQFSFCVALYRALHGIHPFAGDDRDTLARAVLAGERREPTRLRVPRRIHRALVRGLSRAAGDRFATMPALLRTIEPRSPWRRAAPALLLAVAGAGGLASMIEADPCADTHALLAGTWDAERRAATRQAFAASGLPDSELLWATTVSELDAHAAAVVASHVASCREQQRGASSPRLHDLRVACLRRRLAVVRSIVDALTPGDVAALRRAPQAAMELDDSGECTDDRTLLLGMEAPAPADAVAVAQIQGRIDRARGLELIGDLHGSRALIEGALGEARELAYAPTIAEARHRQGQIAVLERDFKAAEAALREALELALASRHDMLVGEVWSALIQALVLGRGDTRGADELLRQAAAWQQRRPASPLEQAMFERTRAVVEHARGDQVKVEAAARRAVEIGERILGPDHLRVAIDRQNLLGALDALGRTDEVLAAYPALLDLLRARVGAGHVLVGEGHYNFGVALLRAPGDAALASAEDHFLRAGEILTAALGPDALELADNEQALAEVARRRRDLDGAQRRSAAALRIFARHPGHPARAHALGFQGAVLFDQGRLDASLAAHVEARELGLAAWGPESDVVAIADSNIADVLREQGDLPGAVRRYTSAIATLERTLGPACAELVGPLLGLGEARLAGGQACEALTALDRGRALMAAGGAGTAELAGVSTIRDAAAARCEPNIP